MPFKSEAQRRFCWAQQKRNEAAGIKSSWNCEEWEHETPKAVKRNLPYKINKNNSDPRSRSNKRSRLRSRSRSNKKGTYRHRSKKSSKKLSKKLSKK